MAGYLSDSQIAAFTGAFNKHFQTFLRPITVNSAPVQVITQTAPPYAGYGGDSIPNDMTFIPVSQVISGQVIFPDDAESQELKDIKDTVAKGKIKIKVDEAGKNLIEASRIENIEIDGKKFNVSSSPNVKSFCGYKTYLYLLEETF